LFLNCKIERWNGNFYIGNYRISFTSYVKSKILKLPIPSNERSLDSHLQPKRKKPVYSSNNSITIYYRIVPLNRYRSTPTAHPWWLYELYSGALFNNKIMFNYKVQNIIFSLTKLKMTTQINNLKVLYYTSLKKTQFSQEIASYSRTILKTTDASKKICFD
jgi:hypothetical protein